MKKEIKELLKQIKFNADGLIPAIVQDYKSKDVLMLAYMNQEALGKTIDSGLAHFFSRSRQKLWMKGESSGHVQRIREIRIDCDADAILLKVFQKVGACHTGYWSCFYRSIKNRKIIIRGSKKFSPEMAYKKI